MAPTTRTYLFYGLNAVRVLSIVALILVFASSIVDMVTNIKAVNNFLAQQPAANGTTTSDDQEFALNCDYIEGSAVPNQPAGVFWAVLSGLLIIFQTIVLILSEVGWPVSFFNRFFPVLGSDFGVGALGIFQCLIGAQILSHHVDEFTLVAAFFLFAIGCLNMFLGLVFREGLKQKRSIVHYRNESRDVLPTTATDTRPVFINASPAFSKGLAAPASEFGTFRSDSISSDKSGYGFGRQGEKAAGLRGFILQKPEESLPRYASPSPKPPSVSSRSPSPAPSAAAAPPTMTFPPPPPVPQSTTPLRLQRWKSTRTSGSSFVSPGAYRHEHNLPSQEDEDEEDIYEDDERSVTPPPTFRSSPTAL